MLIRQCSAHALILSLLLRCIGHNKKMSAQTCMHKPGSHRVEIHRGAGFHMECIAIAILAAQYITGCCNVEEWHLALSRQLAQYSGLLGTKTADEREHAFTGYHARGSAACRILIRGRCHQYLQLPVQ